MGYITTNLTSTGSDAPDFMVAIKSMSRHSFKGSGISCTPCNEQHFFSPSYAPNKGSLVCPIHFRAQRVFFFRGFEISIPSGWFVWNRQISRKRQDFGRISDWKNGVLKSEKLPLWSQHVTILLKWWRTFWMIKLGNLEHSGRCLPRIATL